MLGPRRGRRQGPDPRPRDGRRGAPRDPRRAADQRPLRLRGRGGIELRPPRRLARGEPRPARRRRRDHQRHGLLRGQHAGDHAQPARDHVRPDRRRRDRRSTSTPAATAAPSRTRPTPWPRSSPSSRAPDGRIRIPGFYDDVVALTDDDRAALAALPVRRGRVPRAARRAGARRRDRLHDARAPGDPPDPRRQRDLGRLQGRGQQDDHPGPRPRQGQLPARGGPGPGHDLRGAPGVRRGDRAARRHDDGPLPRAAGIRA